VIISDTISSAFTSPNIDSSVTFISTKNSTIGQGVHNSVIIGGENLVSSLTNSVVLGQYVNINNQYTFPIVDGASGSYMVTDGLGNLYWQTSSAEVQNLEDVLTLGNWTGNNSIEMGTGSVLYSANGGGQINLDYTGPGVVAISTDGGNFNQAYIELANDDIMIVNNSSFSMGIGSASIVVSDGRGLVYAFDYSSTFVTYSLVDKNYVDTLVSTTITGATNGLSEISSGIVGVGGTLSQDTNIYADYNRFTIRDSSGLILSASGSGYSAEIGYVDGLEFNIFYGDEDVASLWSWDGTNTVQISSYTSDVLVGDGSTNNRLVVSDGTYNKGLVYGADYTANFTTHSLVTKGWVSSNTTNKYSITQGFTASVTETITHNLGTDEIIVQCYDSSGIMVIPGTIQINGTNAVDITFSQTLSTIKTVIIG
jgi:hypothetical protein